MDEDRLIKEFEEKFCKEVAPGVMAVDLSKAAADPIGFQWYVDELGIVDSINSATGMGLTGMKAIGINTPKKGIDIYRQDRQTKSLEEQLTEQLNQILKEEMDRARGIEPEVKADFRWLDKYLK